MIKKLTTEDVIRIATEHLHTMSGHVFDLLDVSKPINADAAVNLSKVISKLSPLLGNLIEFNTVEFLNDRDEFKGIGEWERQDPGFPDTVFRGVTPTPGFEIKAWFPLATEITARFKDSQDHFLNDNTYVCMLAWLPEHIIYGKPYLLDVVVVSGSSVAASRDNHYNNPPHYLVLEPENTSGRTRNLQQTNTNGYKLQDVTEEQLETAKRIMDGWQSRPNGYSTSPEYQAQLRQLLSALPYRLDTNYAKMDRIVHEELEKFKTRVLNTKVHGLKVREWDQLFRGPQNLQKALVKAVEDDDGTKAASIRKRLEAAEEKVKNELMTRIRIGETDPDELLE